MRYPWIAAAALSTVLLAQDQSPTVPPKQPEEKPAPPQAAKTCAVPLLNVLKPKTPVMDRMPKVSPPKEKFSTKDVIVPAPSCDDVK